MKLALSIEIQEGLSYPQTLALTQAGEALGFDSSLLAEHYYPSGPLTHYPQGAENRASADAWLLSIGTDPEYEGRGVGQTLVRAFCDALRHDGALTAHQGTRDSPHHQQKSDHGHERDNPNCEK